MSSNYARDNEKNKKKWVIILACCLLVGLVIGLIFFKMQTKEISPLAKADLDSLETQSEEIESTEPTIEIEETVETETTIEEETVETETSAPDLPLNPFTPYITQTSSNEFNYAEEFFDILRNYEYFEGASEQEMREYLIGNESLFLDLPTEELDYFLTDLGTIGKLHKEPVQQQANAGNNNSSSNNNNSNSNQNTNNPQTDNNTNNNNEPAGSMDDMFQEGQMGDGGTRHDFGGNIF